MLLSTFKEDFSAHRFQHYICCNAVKVYIELERIVVECLKRKKCPIYTTHWCFCASQMNSFCNRDNQLQYFSLISPEIKENNGF